MYKVQSESNVTDIYDLYDSEFLERPLFLPEG